MVRSPSSPVASAPGEEPRRRARARVADVTSGSLAHLEGPLWRRAGRLARRVGVRRPCFVLSLDCDTDEDIAVVGDVHERLRAKGIQATYAVPGALLEAGTDTYRAIATTGAEFLNHGSARHCAIDPITGAYTSSFFYDVEPWPVVVGDVRAGHRQVLDVLGTAPTGFRAPHFGTLSGTRRLRRLGPVLDELGYRYSSSSLPLRGHGRGPLHRLGGRWEVPVSGRPSAPTKVLDSWSFRFAPGRVVGPDDYERDLAALVDRLLSGDVGVVNVYADPSQVADWPGFFDVVGRAAPVALPSLSALVDLARP